MVSFDQSLLNENPSFLPDVSFALLASVVFWLPIGFAEVSHSAQYFGRQSANLAVDREFGRFRRTRTVYLSMTTLLFTIAISACYRGTGEIYSAQVIACNGEQLYHLAEAASISEALEKVVQEMRLQEKDGSSFV